MSVRPLAATSVCMVLLLFCAPGGPAEAASLKGPALITSAGQSLGAVMVQVLADRAGVENVFDATAEVETLDEAVSLIVVIGASLKGLDAAGIDESFELRRIHTLLMRSRQLGVPVVAVHLEGAPRRGALSDALARQVFAYAAHAIVRSDGNSDEFFTYLASVYGVQLWTVDATVEAADVLRQLYGE